MGNQQSFPSERPYQLWYPLSLLCTGYYGLYS